MDGHDDAAYAHDRCADRTVVDIWTEHLNLPHRLVVLVLSSVGAQSVRSPCRRTRSLR